MTKSHSNIFLSLMDAIFVVVSLEALFEAGDINYGIEYFYDDLPSAFF